ncbi:MAG TPA: hypothetical protein PKO05_07295 [Thermoanaerobaculia bacterium]|nr:hypothetical protein [Thermoanaerobaculia bacterium]
MADPMFDNFARIIRGEASPATMRFWMGGNLHLDRISGWSSENLALAAWLAELRARMKENAPEPQLAEMRGLIRARFERERDGNYQGIEVYGRVYGLWNYVVRLALYRFCLRLGWAEEAALLRGWLRSHAAALVLAAGDGPGRQITDHQVAAGDADRGAAILGDGALLPWWDPFVAWSGDRGCQRTRDTAEWGRWQHLADRLPLRGPRMAGAGRAGLRPPRHRVGQGRPRRGRPRGAGDGLHAPAGRHRPLRRHDRARGPTTDDPFRRGW